jgi:hypothetical protein
VADSANAKSHYQKRIGLFTTRETDVNRKMMFGKKESMTSDISEVSIALATLPVAA